MTGCRTPNQLVQVINIRNHISVEKAFAKRLVIWIHPVIELSRCAIVKVAIIFGERINEMSVNMLVIEL